MIVRSTELQLLVQTFVPHTIHFGTVLFEGSLNTINNAPVQRAIEYSCDVTHREGGNYSLCLRAIRIILYSTYAGNTPNPISAVHHYWRLGSLIREASPTPHHQ